MFTEQEEQEMSNKQLISMQVELARTAHHAYLECRRLELPALAAAWKLHAQEHMTMAREEKQDQPITREPMHIAFVRTFGSM